MRDNFMLLMGTACALICLQAVQSDLNEVDDVDYEEEGFWIGHGLGSRKDGMYFVVISSNLCILIQQARFTE